MANGNALPLAMFSQPGIPFLAGSLCCYIILCSAIKIASEVSLYSIAMVAAGSSSKGKVLALFDVDGTLTVPRKVKERHMSYAKCYLATKESDDASIRTICSSLPLLRLRSIDLCRASQNADDKMLTFLQELRKVWLNTNHQCLRLA